MTPVVLPRDIPSAVTNPEAMKLHELARDQAVLECGAHFGFSTIVLAQAAKEFHSVDWHYGDSQAGQNDNLLAFRENVRRYGQERAVRAHVGRFEEVLPAFRPSHFDGCFLDGEHNLESVVRDLELVDPLVRLGGWIAFHDYGRFDVQPVVDRYVSVNSYNIEVVDYLAVVRKSGSSRTDVDHFTEKGYKVRGIVHVGANDGAEIPLYRAAGYGPILAFEPHPAAYGRLVEDHGKDALCIWMALGIEDGDLTLYVPEDGDDEKASRYQPIPTPGHDWTSQKYSKSAVVPVKRFDNWADESGLALDPFNCLVIDVQGMEMEVLMGCANVLSEFDFLVVECSEKPVYHGESSAEEVGTFLEHQGFRRDSDVKEHDDVVFVRNGIEPSN